MAKKKRNQAVSDSNALISEEQGTILKKKFKYLVLPFFKVYLFSVVGSALLLFLFVKILDYPSIRSTGNLRYWALAVIVLAELIWLMPLTRLLASSNSRTPVKLLFNLLPLFICGMGFLSWEHMLDKAGGKFIVLKSISEIERESSAVYYKINQYYVWKQKAGSDYDLSVWKNDRNRDASSTFYVSFAAPCFESAKDTMKNKCAAWVIVDFEDRYEYAIDNKFGVEGREFYERFAKEYGNKNLQLINHFRRVRPLDKNDIYMRAILNSKVVHYQNEPVLVASFDPLKRIESEEIFNFVYIHLLLFISWLLVILTSSFEINQLRKYELTRLKSQRRRQ